MLSMEFFFKGFINRVLGIEEIFLLYKLKLYCLTLGIFLKYYSRRYIVYVIEMFVVGLLCVFVLFKEYK